MCRPADPSPCPAVLVLTGSGPLDRDGSYRRLRLDVSRHWARTLADHGIASFRYDKRGVGASPGDWRAAGPLDLVGDAKGRVTSSPHSQASTPPAYSCSGTARAPCSPAPRAPARRCSSGRPSRCARTTPQIDRHPDRPLPKLLGILPRCCHDLPCFRGMRAPIRPDARHSREPAACWRGRSFYSVTGSCLMAG